MIQLAFSDIQLDQQPIFSDLHPHIVKQFFDYHRANPRVYHLFKQYAYEIKFKGNKHYGAKAIMERIRWHVEIETNSGDFKINNNYASCYARLLIWEEPGFKDYFEIRHSPTIGMKVL